MLVLRDMAYALLLMLLCLLTFVTGVRFIVFPEPNMLDMYEISFIGGCISLAISYCIWIVARYQLKWSFKTIKKYFKSKGVKYGNG